MILVDEKKTSASVTRCPEKANRATPNNYSQYTIAGCGLYPTMSGLKCSPLMPPNSSLPLSLQIVQGTRDKSKIPPCPPALIEGIVRERGKFLIAGASKSWKSFLTIQLAVAVASGDPWLTFSCKQGKVLYVNLEIDDNQFRTRVAEIASAMNVDNDLLEKNLSIMLRQTEPFNAIELVTSLIYRFKEGELDLVLIDPVYFLIDGSENETHTMKQLCEQIDRICKTLGCAVGVVHHHSKGVQSKKDVLDRACGSSVLGRFFDAVIDVGRLKAKGNAMRMEFVLRDYPEQPPENYRFIYPLCVSDTIGELASCNYASSRNPISRKTDKQAAKLKQVEAKCEELLGDRDWIDRTELCDALDIEGRKISSILKNSEKYKVESGCNYSRVSRKK